MYASQEDSAGLPPPPPTPPPPLASGSSSVGYRVSVRDAGLSGGGDNDPTSPEDNNDEQQQRYNGLPYESARKRQRRISEVGPLGSHHPIPRQPQSPQRTNQAYMEYWKARSNGEEAIQTENQEEDQEEERRRRGGLERLRQIDDREDRMSRTCTVSSPSPPPPPPPPPPPGRGGAPGAEGRRVERRRPRDDDEDDEESSGGRDQKKEKEEEMRGGGYIMPRYLYESANPLPVRASGNSSGSGSDEEEEDEEDAILLRHIHSEGGSRHPMAPPPPPPPLPPSTSDDHRHYSVRSAHPENAHFDAALPQRHSRPPPTTGAPPTTVVVRDPTLPPSGGTGEWSDTREQQRSTTAKHHHHQQQQQQYTVFQEQSDLVIRPPTMEERVMVALYHGNAEEVERIILATSPQRGDREGDLALDQTMPGGFTLLHLICSALISSDETERLLKLILRTHSGVHWGVLSLPSEQPPILVDSPDGPSLLISQLPPLPPRSIFDVAALSLRLEVVCRILYTPYLHHVQNTQLREPPSARDWEGVVARAKLGFFFRSSRFLNTTEALARWTRMEEEEERHQRLLREAVRILRREGGSHPPSIGGMGLEHLISGTSTGVDGILDTRALIAMMRMGFGICRHGYRYHPHQLLLMEDYLKAEADISIAVPVNVMFDQSVGNATLTASAAGEPASPTTTPFILHQLNRSRVNAALCCLNYSVVPVRYSVLDPLDGNMLPHKIALMRSAEEMLLLLRRVMARTDFLDREEVFFKIRSDDGDDFLSLAAKYHRLGMVWNAVQHLKLLRHMVPLRITMDVEEELPPSVRECFRTEVILFIDTGSFVRKLTENDIASLVERETGVHQLTIKKKKGYTLAVVGSRSEANRIIAKMHKYILQDEGSENVMGVYVLKNEKRRKILVDMDIQRTRFPKAVDMYDHYCF